MTANEAHDEPEVHTPIEERPESDGEGPEPNWPFRAGTSTRPRARKRPQVSLAALTARDKRAEAVVWDALDRGGFKQEGDVFRDSLAGLQRYLGNRPDGRPDAHALTWLALRTQLFELTD